MSSYLGGLLVTVLLFLSLLSFSKPPEEPSPPKLAVDDAIRQNCAKQFESAREIQECFAREGMRQAQKEAEEDKQHAIEEQREQRQIVCLPEAAKSNCEKHVISSTKIGNNPKIGGGIKSDVISECFAMCNPKSSYVLRNYLHGCRSFDNDTIKRMVSLSNSCGHYSETIEARNFSNDVSQSAQNFSELSWSDRATVLGARSGFASGRSLSTSREGSSVTSYALSGGVEYVKVENSAGETTYKYRGPNGSLHDSYKAAAQVRETKAYSVSTAEGLIDDDITGAEDPTRSELTFGRNITENPSIQAEYVLGETVPESATKPVGEPPQIVTETPTKERIERASTHADNQPIYQQASAPGAFLQNTLNSPIGSTPINGGSSGNFAGGGEVARAGSSGSSSSFGGGGSLTPIKDFRPTPTSLANNINNEVSGSALTPASIANLDPVQSNRGGISSAAFAGAAGRMVAANRTSATFDSSGISPDKLRSDSFYKTNGRMAPTRSRLVQSDPNCRPTKTRGCAMKRVAIKGAGGPANCDGNPECILKLTGKLQFKNNVSQTITPIGKRERGIASVVGAKGGASNRLPEGVWRGYIDVLAHMNNIGADYLKLDHEGFLTVGD